MKKYVVCDIGGSSIKYGLMDEEGHFIDKGKIVTPKSLGELYQVLTSIYQHYDDVAGVAISMPGAIDPERGYTYTSGALGYYNNTEFVKELSAYIPVPITIGNDAKCAANAEVGYGALKDVDDAYVIVLGTGIGGCLVMNHKVVPGKHFASGEVSGLLTDYHHPKNVKDVWATRCGIQGLLEHVQEALGEEIQLSGIEIFERANHGDEKVIAGIDAFAREVAIQIININTIVDLERVAIGGGISVQPLLLQLIQKNYDDIYHYYQQYAFPWAKVEIVNCQFNNDANLIGALYQHLISE